MLPWYHLLNINMMHATVISFDEHKWERERVSCGEQNLLRKAWIPTENYVHNSSPQWTLIYDFDLFVDHTKDKRVNRSTLSSIDFISYYLLRLYVGVCYLIKCSCHEYQITFSNELVIGTIKPQSTIRLFITWVTLSVSEWPKTIHLIQ